MVEVLVKFTDHKDVLRRFIADAEAGRVRRADMKYTGSMGGGLLSVAFAIALGMLVGSIITLVL